MGSEVGGILATDPDAGSNAEVHYAIVPGEEGSMFDVTAEQSQQGVVILKTVRLDGSASLVYQMSPVRVTPSCAVED